MEDQKTNGAMQTPSTMSANAIRNIEFLNIWKCLTSIATSKLIKEIGTSREPKTHEKLFTPDQIAQCVKIKRLLRNRFEELYDIEAAFNEQKAMIAKECEQIQQRMKAEEPKETTALAERKKQDLRDTQRLQELLLQLQEAASNYEKKMNARESALPDLTLMQFYLSSLEGYTLANNGNEDAFYTYLVDLEK